MLIPVLSVMKSLSAEQLSEELGKIVGTASLELDGDVMKDFTSIRAAETEAWKNQRAYLKEVGRINNLEADHIYTFRLNRNNSSEVYWAVMLHKEPFIGQSYQVPKENIKKLKDLIKTGIPQTTDIYTDQYGTWISAFAAIRDQNREVVGIIQADHRVSAGNAIYLEILREYFLPIAAIFVVVMVLGFIMVLLLTRTVTNPIQQIVALARYTSMGHWDHPMPEMKWNELRQLGGAFERMRQKIQSQLQDLIVFNQELETKVEQKTKNLVTANEELRRAQMDLEKQATANIEFQKTHDPLTGLGNRVWFTDQLTLAIAKAQLEGAMVAVFIMGLDRFHKVNELAGNTEGDRVLKEIAERLQGSLKTADVVARVDGDGFGVALTGITREEAMIKVGQRLLDRISQPFKVRHMTVHLAASIGISVYPSDSQDVSTLLRDAGTAMFNAKKDGGNAFRFYTQSMDEESRRQLALESGLRRALDNEEFQLYYQPQIDVNNGEIIGVETLVRWISPEEGLIPPSEFIPLAEETGLIVPLGKWIIRTACMHRKKWNDLGLPRFLVAINLSGRQFEQTDLVPFMKATVDEIGIEPISLELEITESIAMKDVSTTISKLAELKAMGMTLAIDDFGTGYSSLAYLKQFAIEKLKIDRSFINEVTQDSEDAAIVNAIIQLGHSLSLKVIAEGVEYQDQLDFLKEHGCDEYQGYFFSKPIPEEDLVELVQKITAGA